MCKWGCDGSSRQSIYKQKFASTIGKKFDDASILMTTIVLIKLSDSSDSNIFLGKF